MWLLLAGADSSMPQGCVLAAALAAGCRRRSMPSRTVLLRQLRAVCNDFARRESHARASRFCRLRDRCVGCSSLPKTRRQANEAIHQYENRTASVALVSYTTLATTLDLTKNALASRAHCTARTARYRKSTATQRAQRFGRKKPPQERYHKGLQGC